MRSAAIAARPGLPLFRREGLAARPERNETYGVQIFAQVKGLFYKDDDPIIGIQFENERNDNAPHLLTPKRLA